jgi:hypothetical protein
MCSNDDLEEGFSMSPGGYPFIYSKARYTRDEQEKMNDPNLVAIKNSKNIYDLLLFVSLARCAYIHSNFFQPLLPFHPSLSCASVEESKKEVEAMYTYVCMHSVHLEPSCITIIISLDGGIAHSTLGLGRNSISRRRKGE